jgi:serine/threonine protein kinase
VFARKLLQPFGKLRREDIRNELRAVDKLCKSLNHPNIVAVLNFGTMDRYYFLDMELCDLTLETHLRQEWDEATAAKLPYFSTPPSARMKMIQILGIMEDVAAGVAFIHLHNEIHRDLKPRNGMPLLIVCQLTANSHVLLSRSQLEDCRLRTY